VNHTHRQIDKRARAAQIDRHVQAAREQAIIRYVFWKRG
jgi:hypothetical protein